jgi:hypothetical protein
MHLPKVRTEAKHLLRLAAMSPLFKTRGSWREVIDYATARAANQATEHLYRAQ